MRQPPTAQRHFAAEAAHTLALRNRLASDLKAISPHTVVFDAGGSTSAERDIIRS
ncbi:MAG: hypothetical protein ACREHD_25455 [Pirellulales bacterium]